jgi:hypothetical protein
MTFLRHVRPDSEVSPKGYPATGISMPAQRNRREQAEGKSGKGGSRKYTAERAVREEE